MEIVLFETLPSTQEYLVEMVYAKKIAQPIAIVAKDQTNGIGSRDNEWSSTKGNLTVSILLNIDSLPDDLPLMSASIYFGFIMKTTLESLVGGVWLKWPNDLYLNEHKIGGIITKKIGNQLVVGIGINLKKSENRYSSLESDIEPLILLNMFLEDLKEGRKWQEVFRQYKVEFEKNKGYFTHLGDEIIEIKNSIINSDGSLEIGDRKVYSKR